MGQKVEVGGTGRDLKGGKVLIGGTAYAIKKGRTLKDGTGYDVSFSEDGYVISFSGGVSSSGLYTASIVVGNQTYPEPGDSQLDIVVAKGDAIKLRTSLGVAYAAIVVYLNGTIVYDATVIGGDADWEYTPGSNCTITVDYRESGGVRYNTWRITTQ